MPRLPATGSVSDLVKVSVPMVAFEPASLPAGSAEIYSRIAMGARACWFGPVGRYNATHILHADVASSADGGAVEIVVHERAADQPKPWGYKAYRIALAEVPHIGGEAGGASTTIKVENLRMGAEQAGIMRAEVYRWAAGTQGCGSGAAVAADAVAGGALQAAQPIVNAPAGAEKGARPARGR